MAGLITRLAVEEGETATPSTFSRDLGLLMTVSDLSVIQVDVRVDETDVVRLSLGDSADIEIDAFPDTSFAGRVTRISQSARQAAGQATGEDRAVDYDVEITLDNPPPDIRPDLSATARMVTETRANALSIPIIALTQREHRRLPTESAPSRRDTGLVDTEGVFVIQGGRAQFRPVSVGITGEEHFEVIAGLTEGDSIVAGPYQVVRDLTDSALVRPIEPPPGERAGNDRGAVAAAQAETPPPSANADNGGAGQTDTALQPAEAAGSEEDAAGTQVPRHAVQVAAVRTENAADEVVSRLRNAGYEPTVLQDADGLYKIRVGDFVTRSEAQDLANELRAAVGGTPFVVNRS
jgi:cell division septation protein DedD